MTIDRNTLAAALLTLIPAVATAQQQSPQIQVGQNQVKATGKVGQGELELTAEQNADKNGKPKTGVGAQYSVEAAGGKVGVSGGREYDHEGKATNKSGLSYEREGENGTLKFELGREGSEKSTKHSFGTTYEMPFGARNVTGKLSLKAGLEREKERADDSKDSVQEDKKPEWEAKAGLDVKAKFFAGKDREVAAIELKRKLGKDKPKGRSRSNAVTSREEAEARPDASGGSSKDKKKDSKFDLEIRLCGFKIEPTKSKDRVTPPKQKTPPRSLMPRDASLRFMVGPVPIIVRSNAGVGVERTVDPLSFDEAGNPQARMGIGAYAHGWVSGGVGGGTRMLSVSAGVRAILRMLDTTADLVIDLAPGENGHPAAGIELTQQAARFRLLAYARAQIRIGWRRLSRSWQRMLFNVATPVRKHRMDLL